MLKKLLLIAFLVAVPLSLSAQTITRLDQWASTSTPVTSITQRIFGMPIRITGLSDGCLGLSSGIVTSSGSPCGSGSGGGAVDSVSNSDSTLTISPTTGAVVASLNLAKANTWSALQTFGNLLATSATSTNFFSTTASSTNLFASFFTLGGKTLSLSSNATVGGTNTGDVTLAGTPDYITISGQTITRGTIDVSDDTNLTAGDALTLTGDDIDFDGGASPAGDLGGTWANPSVDDDSHAHTGTTLSGIDISDDTNLTAGDHLTLTGDDLDVDDDFILNTGDVGTGSYTFPDLISTRSTSTHATSTTLTVTGSLRNTGLSDGCVEVSSGLFTSTGSNCGTGGGGITSLNSLTGSSQTFATGTATGIGLNIVSSGTTHTFTPTVLSDYSIFKTASGTNWNAFYDTPSTRITAGTGLSWAGNTLNSTAGTVYLASTTPWTTGQLAQVAGNGTLNSIATSSLNLTTSSFLSPNISQWTNNSGYLTGNETITISGDVDGSGTTAITATLDTVNANTGSFGSSTAIPNFTVNGKGLITAAGTNAVVAPAGTLTGNTLASGVTNSSLTSIGTLASGAVPASLVTAGTFGAGNYTFPSNLIITGNSTTTHATTTSIAVTGSASSTAYRGAGLATCNGSTSGLSWANGLFGCATIAPPASAITSGAAITKTDDTNVTLTLGGSPNTAVLAATSFTLGWTGTLSDARTADNLTISGGTVNNSPIGATTPSTGVFTNATSTNLFATSTTAVGLNFTNATGTSATTTNFRTTNFTATTICLTGDSCRTTWPTGGSGGSGGGAFSTTTSPVPGQLIVYPNNDTDIVAIGANSTTTAEFFIDPNIATTTSIDTSGLIYSQGLKVPRGMATTTQTSASNSTSPKDVTATCPAGYIVTGGGGVTSTGNLNALYKSQPTTDGTGWTAGGIETPSSTSNWTVTAYAICTKYD